MNFAFSEEQQAYRETLRRFLEEKSPVSEVFRWMESREGYDPGVWKQLAVELGLLGVQVPERYGGTGFGSLELGIAMEEMGRALLCAPFLSTACLAAGALLEVGDEPARREWLPLLCSGDCVASLALLDAGDAWDPAEVRTEARPDGSGYVLRGDKRLVTDGARADLLLVVARLPETRGRDGVTLLAVRGDAQGLAATPVEGLDATRKLADLRLDGARGALIGVEGGAADGLDRALARAAAALAAESAGGAARCLEAAVDYAGQRLQFGRPIGSFQAIKHRCADALLEVESAKSAAYWACWTADARPDQLPLAASVAKSFCDEAFGRVALDNLHVHGGMGFTWEADCHLYLKRARANAALLGSPAQHRRRIAELKGF